MISSCEALIELLLAQEGDIQKKIFGSRILQQFKAAWTADEGIRVFLVDRQCLFTAESSLACFQDDCKSTGKRKAKFGF